MTGIGGHHHPHIGLVIGPAVLVAAANERRNVLMTETETGIETGIIATIGTEGEGVALLLMKGDVLQVPTGGQ